MLSTRNILLCGEEHAETLHHPEGRIFRVLRVGVRQEGRDTILEYTRPGLQLQLEESREDGRPMHAKNRGSCAWWRANVSGDMAVPVHGSGTG